MSTTNLALGGARSAWLAFMTAGSVPVGTGGVLLITRLPAFAMLDRDVSAFISNAALEACLFAAVDTHENNHLHS